MKLREFIQNYKDTRTLLSQNEGLLMNSKKFHYDVSYRMLDIQDLLFKIIVWTLEDNISNSEQYRPLLVSGFYKSLIGLYSCLELDKKGLFGSSRIIMRNIFEFHMIAKFCSISKDYDIYQRWDQGIGYPIKKILKKISKPDTEEFEIFWGVLCNYTHASKYSQQITLDIELNKVELAINSALVRVLIENNYHLLNSHLINSSILYYHQEFASSEEQELYKNLKKEMLELKKKSKNKLADNSRKLIYNYKLKWNIS